jgi:hypothetical protein
MACVAGMLGLDLLIWAVNFGELLARWIAGVLGCWVAARKVCARGREREREDEGVLDALLCLSVRVCVRAGSHWVKSCVL